MHRQCFCESRWAQLTKDFDYALNLGYLDGTQTDLKAIIDVCTQGGARRPPMTPADFLDELEAKSFTNGKEDRPKVGELYRKGFEMEMGQAKELNYSSLGWADMEMKSEMVQLCKVISSGAMAKLTELYLGKNQIGDVGMAAFSRAIASGAMGLLTVSAKFAPPAFLPCPYLPLVCCAGVVVGWEQDRGRGHEGLQRCHQQGGAAIAQGAQSRRQQDWG